MDRRSSLPIKSIGRKDLHALLIARPVFDYHCRTKRFFSILFKENGLITVVCQYQGLEGSAGSFFIFYSLMPFSLSAAISAGIISGIIATVVQMALWWLFQEPLPEILYRDARLAAAILMGPEVLPPPASFNWKVMMVATFVHFLISIAYSVILARLIFRLDMLFSLFIGAIFGALVYLVNMYGFTLIFPWFSMVRDWITFFTHIAFGISLAVTYIQLARQGL